MNVKHFNISIGKKKKFLFWNYNSLDESKIINSQMLERELYDSYGVTNIHFYTNAQKRERHIMVTDKPRAGEISKDIDAAFDIIKKYFPDAKEVKGFEGGSG